MVKNKSMMRKIFKIREQAKGFVDFNTLPPMTEETRKVFDEALKEFADNLEEIKEK